MPMNTELLMTHCCNCGHLVSRSASGTKSIMICQKCGSEIEITVSGRTVTVSYTHLDVYKRQSHSKAVNPATVPQYAKSRTHR